MTKRDAFVDAIACVDAYRLGDWVTAAEIISDAGDEGVDAVKLLASRLMMVAGYARQGWERGTVDVDRGMANLGLVACGMSTSEAAR